MKPSIPSGTRDFSPTEMARRNYILDTIKKYFRLYGFEQIETPAMENLETLMGKYGEEGDKLIYKILNSGDYLNDLKINAEELGRIKEIINEKSSTHIGVNGLMVGVLDSKKHTNEISKRALRYDLTVPFARYVVQHQNEITFPFKRFQIQPVWRADNPQKGRYREFYQCDADMIGSNSLVNEVELIQLMNDVYSDLGLDVTIKINNRKILAGIAEVYGATHKLQNILDAFDSLDKIGIDNTIKNIEEGLGSGLVAKNITRLINFVHAIISCNSNDEKINKLTEDFEHGSSIGKTGVGEIQYILSKVKKNVEFDVTLARGLNYYTGTIIEVKANKGTLKSSITGGGRYDDLTGIFGLPNMSGVGISFGVDRIYDVMDELNLFPADKLNKEQTQVLVMHMGEEEQQHGMQLLFKLRKMNIRAEIYPDVTKKINKQFDYATKKNIPYSIVIGSNEMNTEKYTLKTKDDRYPDLTFQQIVNKIIQTR